MAEAEFEPVHSVALDEIKYGERSTLLRNFAQLRRSLVGGQRRDGESIGVRLRRAFQTKLGLAGPSLKKGGKQFDCDQFSTIEDFTKCADEVIQQLLLVNKDHDGQLVAAREVENTRAQLHNKSVFLSFYGQYSSGKSTILNSILHNQFLPVDRSPETSVTLCISPTQEGEEFMDGMMRYNSEFNCSLSDDVKQNCLMQNSVQLANGVNEIRGALKRLNKRARNATSLDTRSCKYDLKAKFPLSLHVPDGWTIYFIDNPGFDEYSAHVTEVAMTGLGISSAILYITTHGTYRQVTTTGFFQSMYQKNNAIFKDRRFIVIINKADKVCCNNGNLDAGMDEDDLSEEAVVSEVHQFIVKICKCLPEDVPRDVIIPLYGLWACRARMLAREPNSVDQRKRVIKILCDLSTLPSGQGESPERCYAELSSQELASKLQELTGILEVEKRLQEMAKSSILVWIQKINYDLGLFLEGSIQKLNRKIGSHRKKQEENDHDLNRRLMVTEDICTVYKRVAKIPSDNGLRQTFREMFEMDMKMANPRAAALEVVQLKIIKFKEKLKSTVKQRKDYGPEEFVEHLNTFIQELLAKLEFIINSRCFINMLDICNEKFRITTVEMARLGTRLESLSRASSGECDDFLTKKVKDAAPKFTLPKFNGALGITPPNVCDRLQDKLRLKYKAATSALKDKMPSVDFMQYLQDFYENKPYFMEACDGSGQDSTNVLLESKHTSKRSHDSSLERSPTIKEEEVAGSMAGKSIQVKVDIEKDQDSSDNRREDAVIDSEQSSHSSSSVLMEPFDQAHTIAVSAPNSSSAIVPEQEEVDGDDVEASGSSSVCVSPTPSTNNSCQDDTSSGVPSDQETPAKSRQRRGFRRYSELEHALGELEESLNKEIRQYFENFEDIAVEGFCNSYHEATFMSLKNFDSTYKEQLDSVTEELQKELYILHAEDERLKESDFQHTTLKYMHAQFVFMAGKYQKEVF